MIETRLKISSDNYYNCELTKKIEIKIFITAIQLPVGFGIHESLTGKEEPLIDYFQKLKESNQIKTVEITYRSTTTYFAKVEHELEFPSIFETILECGSMTILPIVISGGFQYHTIYSPTQTILRKTLDQLNKRFSFVKVKTLSTNPKKLNQSLLTQKQSEAIQLAYQHGYYNIPKDIYLKDLVDKIDVKRVAFQERVKRAENKIIKNYLENEITFK